MPYVNVPNDLTKIKTKMALNLTKRQLICFGGAAVIGVPAYLLARSAIGNSAAMLLMIALMLPCFFMALYERDGLPAEKVVKNIILARFIRPGPRPYKTENFYNILNKEADYDEAQKATTPAPNRKAQTHRAAHSTADHSVPRNENGRRL